MASLQEKDFPFLKSNAYNLELIKERSVGGNVLYSLEALTEYLPLKPGMKVLDLGCGKALSSVFLAKEFGVTVWAVDNFFSPSENAEFIRSWQLENAVFPLQLDANRLPFANNFFDCIVVVNSYTYFGTGDKYLPYLSRFLRPDGQLGIADIGLRSEIETVAEVPGFLQDDFSEYWYHVHSMNWWKNKWEKTGLVSVLTAGEVTALQDALMREAYINFHQHNREEAFSKALLQDVDKTISFFNLVGKRTHKHAWLEETFT